MGSLKYATNSLYLILVVWAVIEITVYWKRIIYLIQTFNIVILHMPCKEHACSCILKTIFFILVVRPIIQIGAYLAFAGNGSGV